MSDATMGSRAGSMLGPYRLLRVLGPGGFGEVYEAEDTSLNRKVALKLIAAPYSHDSVFRERLFREAQHAARLHDPHVVPIHGCGEIDGQLYIDMRLVEGINLQTLLARHGPLDPPRAVGIVRQIASALDAAHANQVIHRDVKPANILIADDDFVCLVDFGLASAVGEVKLTNTGTTVGTFAYMAPERFGNADVGAPADVYALACVLYECLTGVQPYPRSELPALVTAHLTAPIPLPSQDRPHIAVGLDEVIMRGMAKDPAQRYASAGELALAAQHALATPVQDHIETILVSHDTAAPVPAAPTVVLRTGRAPRATGGRRRLAIAAGVLTLAAAAAVGLLVIHGHRPPPAAPPQVATSAQMVLANGLDDPRGVTVDGSGTVYVAESGNDKVAVLAHGSVIPTVLRFTGARDTLGVAVDSTGVVYVTDAIKNLVLSLSPGATTPTVLPFTGLDYPSGVAVDSSGTVYVADTGNHRVLALPAGSSRQKVLPFAGLPDTCGVAVDGNGTVYVTDTRNNEVLMLPGGSAIPTVLPFTGLHYPSGVAVDSTGTVYVADSNDHRVLKLAAGAPAQGVLPFAGLKSPWGVAVDRTGNVYVTDSQNNRTLRLPPGA